MTGDRSLLENFIEKFIGIVCFGNIHFAAITCYGDYVQGNITIFYLYYVEGLGHNLFSVGQFCNSDLEVAFRSKTYYMRNLKGDDLLTGDRESNLYTISISDMAAFSPVFLMSKATSTKSWLWHYKLSHLNFGNINDLTKHDLVDGLVKLKYGKDLLYSAYFDGNTVFIPYDAPHFEEAKSSTTALDPSNMHEFHQAGSRDCLSKKEIIINFLQGTVISYNERFGDDETSAITPSAILTPSPVLSPSLLFDPRYFFVPEKLLPHKKLICSSSSSSTTLSNSSRNQTCNLVSPFFSLYTPTPPQIFEIGKCSVKMHLNHHEEQIEDILNYLDELYLHHIKKMEEGRINGNELKTELKEIRTQIIKLQKKRLGQKDKIAFAYYRISDLERIIEKIQARHQTNQEDL
ncbi:integrase, catalytic region, zinc finger, CCHC-type containing protein [Tanacetum coccineum]